ncbi:CD225/dispanin family protein [Flavobacterium agricola]|uniref:CD225/dispanin family protein n=1 Tax=Flavobacterium agricola TaxID=2870839 RepID=A0ABY6M2M2_9FLAO|nr:CD225/dispanin family protein [Flavobacterium agricola]UYW02537.1 CD225/dispanin family protein [Flavobacterium agricola]
MENHNSRSSFEEVGQAPDNYLVWAILSTILCCMPLGIVSIVKSSNVNTLWSQGRFEEAHKASKAAKNFAIYSAVAACVLWVLYVIFFVFVGMAGVFAENY